MKASGLSDFLSDAFVSNVSAQSFHVLAFLSAGLLNFFIPSGGGQFYIQGPMLIQAASELGLSIPKTIMALSYGDQWTNMLQPFWALPLLGITKIKLKDIFPYCLALFAISGVIFMMALLVF
jgi:short-chain fatty acids transporter